MIAEEEGMMWKKIKRKIDHYIATYFDNRVVLKVDSGSFIHDSCDLRGATISGKVHFGEHAAIKDGVNIQADNELRVGRYTSINGPNMDIRCKVYPVEIGNFCSIARDVVIQEFNHPVGNISTYYIGKKFFGVDQAKEAISKGPIKIGHDVWIGTHSVILSGAEIGNGAIVAANSVVNKPIPPYAIVAGSPAKVIKKRFNDTIIEKLQEIKWWDWDREKILQNRNLFEGELTKEKLESVE